MAFTLVVYVLAAIALAVSLARDRRKTTDSVRKGAVAFLNILPQLSAVLLVVGLMITFLREDLIARVLGEGSGAWGMLGASLAGSITLIPGFIAFPLAKSLLSRGAGVTQMAVFVSTLMTVGVVTGPLEARFFGKRETILRNSLNFVFSFVVALIISVVVTRA